jgi:hypothetical protein
MVFWYNDNATYTLGISTGQSNYSGIGAPDDGRVFVSFDPNERVYVADIGNLTVYLRLNFTAADNGLTTWFSLGAYDWIGGGVSFGNNIRIVGLLNQEQAGPFVGSVAGATEAGVYQGSYDHTWFSFGVYNIGLQMTAGNWTGPGGIKERVEYSPDLWNIDAKVIIAEIVSLDTFNHDKNLIYGALANGKIVILPSVPFNILAIETGETIRTLDYQGLVFKYIKVGSGGVISASIDDYEYWTCNWVVRAGPYYYPQMHVPVDNYIILAQGYNRVCMALSNQPPVAVCRDIQIPLQAGCQASIVASDIDGGSYEPDGDEVIISADNMGPLSIGEHFIKLTALDGHGGEDSCMAKVTVVDETPPLVNFVGPVCTLIGGNGNYANEINISASDACSQIASWTIDKVEVYNQGGNLVLGNGIYSVVGNSTVYIYPNTDTWTFQITVTAIDQFNNQITTSFRSTLKKCSSR